VEDTRLVTHRSDDVIADAALAALLLCPAGQRWVRVVGFRYAGRERLPMAMTTIYLNAAFGGIRQLIGTQKVPVYTLIERQYGQTIVEVRQQISAQTLAAADARELKVKAGSAGLVVTRHYIGADGRVLEVAVNLHPADRFSYSMSLHLQRPAGT
jgi:DNA-binding GntR family transcriptional regulator